MEQQQRLLGWLYALLTILAAAGVLWLLWQALRVLAPVLVVVSAAGVIAAILGPLADRIHRAIHWRPLAALAVVLLLLAPFLVLLFWLASTVQREALGLLQGLPQQFSYVNAVLANWQGDLARAGVHVDLAAEAAGATSAVLRHALGVLSTAAQITTEAVLALVVSFFLILDRGAMSRAGYRLLPPAWQPAAREVGRIVGTVLAEYVRGQFIVCAVFGLLVGVSMALLGLPYSALLGFLAGILELVPTIGPLLGGVAPVALALAQPFPHVIWVLLTFIAAQQVESNFLVPRISGGMVGLHPLTVILGVFTGWQLAGFGGALIAVPVVAAGREIIRRWWQPALSAPLRRWPGPGIAARRGVEAEPQRPEAEAAPPLPLPAVRAEPPSGPAGRRRARSPGQP